MMTKLYCFTLLAIFSSPVFAVSLDFDNMRAGGRLSSIDLDNALYDDTVGVGAFLEVPFDPRTKFGVAVDFWSTEDRLTESVDLSDAALSAFGKYYLAALDEDISPYGVAGMGFHYIQSDDPEKSNTSVTGSFDIGIGFEARLTDFIAMNGEMKFRNVNNHDYNDYGLGVIAKF